ncbi:hypothetical protein HK097_008259 [Rhizophlyctis rosea]|uniref:BTB domain-containing protein n=1 Tax=Rhizophlyctis rosea TaxID=64517 RepID=A0AAD5SAJ7_9FUNG|nr:hypothetical protein HK097_008259 [Rhizophlyctis rosea]
MLEFMYTQQITGHMPAQLSGKLKLTDVCEFYQVLGMHEYVARHVLQHISPESAIRILEVGYRCRAMSDALAKGAAKYLKDNWMELSAKAEFTNTLTMDGVGDLLKYALQGNW